MVSVATFPFEMKTAKRPFALKSPSTELNAEFGVDVSWATNGSGVGLDVWATTEETAPAVRADTMIAHMNQKTCFTKILRNKDADTSGLDALGEREQRRTQVNC